MTTYTAIPNADIDQDSPVTQPLMTALRDNPIAITEGAIGAPRIVAAGIEGGDVATSGEVYYSEGDGTGLWGLAENIEATKSLGADGYVKLPGGAIMQWGVITVSANSAGTETLPTAFTSATSYSVVTNQIQDTSFDRQPIKIGTKSASQFTIQNTNGIEVDINWIAIGY